MESEAELLALLFTMTQLERAWFHIGGVLQSGERANMT